VALSFDGTPEKTDQPRISDVPADPYRLIFPWGFRRIERSVAALGLQDPVFARLEQLKSNDPTNGFEILFHPDHPNKRNETFWPSKLQGRPDFDFPFGKKAAATATDIYSLDIVLELVTMLIATIDFETDLQMDALMFSGDEVLDWRFLFSHASTGCRSC
jgi:hypothetical protein